MWCVYVLINVVQKKGVRNIKETLDILFAIISHITWFYRRKQQTYLALNDLYVVMLCDVGMLPKWYVVSWCIEWRDKILDAVVHIIYIESRSRYIRCWCIQFIEMMHYSKAEHTITFVLYRLIIFFYRHNDAGTFNDEMRFFLFGPVINVR